MEPSIKPSLKKTSPPASSSTSSSSSSSSTLSTHLNNSNNISSSTTTTTTTKSKLNISSSSKKPTSLKPSKKKHSNELTSTSSNTTTTSTSSLKEKQAKLDANAISNNSSSISTATNQIKARSNRKPAISISTIDELSINNNNINNHIINNKLKQTQLQAYTQQQQQQKPSTHFNKDIDHNNNNHNHNNKQNQSYLTHTASLKQANPNHSSLASTQAITIGNNNNNVEASRVKADLDESRKNLPRALSHQDSFSLAQTNLTQSSKSAKPSSLKIQTDTSKKPTSTKNSNKKVSSYSTLSSLLHYTSLASADKKDQLPLSLELADYLAPPSTTRLLNSNLDPKCQKLDNNTKMTSSNTNLQSNNQNNNTNTTSTNTETANTDVRSVQQANARPNITVNEEQNASAVQQDTTQQKEKNTSQDKIEKKLFNDANFLLATPNLILSSSSASVSTSSSSSSPPTFTQNSSNSSSQQQTSTPSSSVSPLSLVSSPKLQQQQTSQTATPTQPIPLLNRFIIKKVPDSELINAPTPSKPAAEASSSKAEASEAKPAPENHTKPNQRADEIGNATANAPDTTTGGGETQPGQAALTASQTGYNNTERRISKFTVKKVDSSILNSNNNNEASTANKISEFSKLVDNADETSGAKSANVNANAAQPKAKVEKTVAFNLEAITINSEISEAKVVADAAGLKKDEGQLQKADQVDKQQDGLASEQQQANLNLTLQPQQPPTDPIQANSNLEIMLKNDFTNKLIDKSKFHLFYLWFLDRF